MAKRISPVVAAFNRYRHRRGISVDDVARKIGRDKANVAKLLNGRRDPRCSQMSEILRAYGLLDCLVECLDAQ